jgi:hypothetical protein
LKCPLSICEKKKYLAKNRNSILFCVFLKTIFFTKKVQNRPRFSALVHPIELKFFLQILETLWGAYFFFCFEKYCTIDVWQTLQKKLSLKNMHF